MNTANGPALSRRPFAFYVTSSFVANDDGGLASVKGEQADNLPAIGFLNLAIHPLEFWIVDHGRLFSTSMRVARPVRDISASFHFYVDILGLDHLGGFAGHDGYDGVFVGPLGADWHIEFTRHVSGRPEPTPTDEDLLVLYVSGEQLESAGKSLTQAGIASLRHENSYWANAGAAVYRDPDGYLVVLCPHADGFDGE
jgi:catechol 2,3-dioxygenase-like lactoylglutathione lyase family enzyme